MKEQRKSRRQQISREALICSNEGKIIAKCYVQDVSDSGARFKLALDEIHSVPNEFVLALAKGAKVVRKCQIVRRGKMWLAYDSSKWPR